MEHAVDSVVSCNRCVWNGSQSLEKEVGIVGNQRTNEAYPEYKIVEIGQNVDVCPEDLRGVAIIQIPVKDRQKMLV